MKEVFELEDTYEIRSYKRMPLALSSGKGCYVFTEEGHKYLDLYGGHAVVGVGHCHPHVVSALKEQISELMFYSNVVFSRVRGHAAKALADMMPEGLKHSFFVNSGAEANENALKMARMVGKKRGILSFHGGFHGRTAAAAAATGIEKVRESVQPVLSDHCYADFGDIDSVARILDEKEIAGVILEPIQSMAGVVTAQEPFLRALRELCDKHNSFLIYDEIQTGIGRVGDFSFAGRFGILPDMVTFGKSLASGVPMGAVVVSSEIASKITVGDLGTTFGGNPIAARALLATIEVIKSENLLKNVREVSSEMKLTLSEFDCVEEVRGDGFLIGIKFKDKLAAEVQSFFLGKNIITGTSGHENVLRLLPPLCLKDELSQMYEAMTLLS